MTVAGRLDKRQSVDAVAAAIMVGLTFSWGLNGVVAKISYRGFDPIFVTLARSVVGGALVLIWCRLRGVKLFERDGTLWLGILAGALFGGEFLLIFVGLEYTTVARNTLLVNTMPFWVLLGAHFLLGERMTLVKLAGLVAAFAGVVLVFADRLSLPSPEALFGDALSLAAGVLWAATTLVIKRSRLTEIGAEKLLLYQLAMASIMALPLLLVSGPAVRGLDALAIGALAFQAIYIVAITFQVWFWLMRRYPASGLASFAFLSPVFGVLCGSVLLGEPSSPSIFIALALIAAGLFMVNWRPRAQVVPGKA